MKFGVQAPATADGVDLRDLAARHGRGHIPTTVYAVDADRVRAERLIDTGADRVVFNAPTATIDETRESLPMLSDLVSDRKTGRASSGSVRQSP